MRMPTDPPMVDPKDEMQAELCKAAGATKEPTDPQIVSFHTVMARYVCCWPDSKIWKEKEKPYDLDYINKL